MSLTTEQYLALSKLAYQDFSWPAVEGKSISYLLDTYDIDGEGTSVLAALSGMDDFTLVNYQPNTGTGFAGVAFQAPDLKNEDGSPKLDGNGNPLKGEIIFAFRGTEPTLFTDPRRALEDFEADMQIAMDTNLAGASQFEDTWDFYIDTLNRVGSGNYDGYSFTGHSLGGGLAQYMVHETNQVGHAVTFNAVGIGQRLDNVNPSDYNGSITDYVNENDVVGQYGVQLGNTVYIADTGNYEFNSAADNAQVALKLAVTDAMKRGQISQAAGIATLNALTEVQQAQYNNLTDIFFGAHNLDTLVTSTGSLSNTVSGPNLAIAALTRFVNGFATVTGWVVDGVNYAAVEIVPAVGEATVKVTVAIGVGVVEVVTVIGETAWDWIHVAGDAAADLIYDTAIAVGDALGGVAVVATQMFQYLFAEYVEVNGSDNDDGSLGAPFYNKSTIIKGYMGDDTIQGSSASDVLDGGLGSDTIYGGYGNDFIYGRQGDDVIEGGGNSDVIFGGDGNDTLYGGDYRNWESFFTPEHASDTLDGGAGDDMLQGGGGDDIYIFGRGYGHDIIFDAAYDVAGYASTGFDTVRFKGNLTPYDIQVSRDYSNLIFTILDTGETLTVSSFFNYRNAIEQVTFPDGTVWDHSTLLSKAQYVTGTSGDDIISGYDQSNIIHAGDGDDTVNGNYFNDEIYGEAGNDVIEAGNGFDVLDGGSGNDILRGGAGNDTYRFGRGYGHDVMDDRWRPYSYSGESDAGFDTLEFVGNITPEDVQVTRRGNYDLEFKIIDTGDTFLVQNHFAYNGSIYALEQVKFADGTIWESADILSRATRMVGTEDGDYLNFATNGDDVIEGKGGNDTIQAGVGNDVLDGGEGDDVLEGSAGNDTYIFRLGYGTDTIFDSDTTPGNYDKVVFGTGIDPSDIIITRNTDNLELSISGTDDKLIIERYFSAYGRWGGYWSGYPYIGDGAHKIEAFEFANGTVWSFSHVEDVLRTITGTSDADYLPGHADLANIISAGDGDDAAYGGALSDTIFGGAGNDYISSDSGNDVLDGGSGDDTIYAGYGNDSIRGGTGNDTLEGSLGDDTYHFNAGDGIDTIYDLDGNEGNLDRIVFGAGIDPEDVVVGREGDNLTLTITGTDDKIIVERYFTAYGRPLGWSGSPYVGENAQKIEQIVFADSTIWDIPTVLEKARHINGTAGDDSIGGYNTDDVITAGAGNDYVYGGNGNDQISGEDGDDVLIGEYGNDTLNGGVGNDTLYAGDGDDILDGGTGDDLLEGGFGNDTYHFNIGSGNDTIFDSEAYEAWQDKIVFGNAISEADVILQRNGDDLVFSFDGYADTLTIERYFSQYGRPSGWSQPHVGINGNKIELIEFADGTIWNNEKVTEKMSHILGTSGDDSLGGIEGQQNKLSGLDGDDTLNAASYGDYLDGGAGSDTLNGSYGQDTLRGGTGDDSLVGGGGKDTYLFAVGDGHDTIYDGDTSFATDTILFSEGIDPSDVEVTRTGSDLILKINGGTDSITVQDYFSALIQGSTYEYGVGVNKVERIVFADGTIWDTSSLEDQLRFVNGTNGNDMLTGYEADDVITAQEGDDVVHAGAGNDVVDAGAGSDTVYGEAGNDQLSGGTGDDVLSGGVGNDILDGGAGNDVLIGGEGSDTYVFGLGGGSDEVRDFSTVISDVDIVAMQVGVSPQGVTVQRDGDDLVLAIMNTSDSLTIKNYFSPYQDGDPTDYGVGVNKIQQVIFDDGTIWNNRTLEYAVNNNGVVDPDVIFGTSQGDSLSTSQNGQTVYADEGDDTINGGAEDDSLHGESGNDTIYGGQGEDTLVGGAGNDHLDGGEGDDTYVFSPGFGHDTIVDYDTTQGNADTIVFTEGITPDDVTISRVGNNLILSLASGDSITIQSYFASAVSGYRKIEQVTFANGTIWDTAFLETAVPPTSAYENTITGTEYSDVLYGTSENDAIDGGAGYDTIYSDNSMYDGAGNDLLDGGTGNDSLFGAGGDDTYVFGIGYGQDYLNDDLRAGGSSNGAYLDGGYDTLKILPGVAPEDIVVRRSGQDLVLEIAGTTDTMTIGAFFRQVEGAYTSAIERVEFSDSSQTVWTLQNLLDKARLIEGTSSSDTLSGHEGQENIINAGAGDDTVYGASGSDTIDGGDGNDMLEGGAGNDVYKFGVGSGVDTIYDSDLVGGNIDTILLQGSIAPEDVIVTRNGDNLELTIVGSTDKLIVEKYFSAYARYYGGWGGPQYVGEDGNKVEKIEFTDGTIWDVATVKEKARYINGTASDDSLSGYGDQVNIISGGDGNDYLYAASYGDELNGGSGDDHLYGGSGNDILAGDAGSDVLEGATGNDTYHFNLGDGADTVYDSDATENNIDVVVFGADILPEDVKVRRNGDHLELSIDGTDDKLTIENYFSQYARYTGGWGGPQYVGENGNKIEQIIFDNGTIWDVATIKAQVATITGTGDADSLSGYSDQQNTLLGLDGDDTLYAGSMGDVLDGGAGNDSLYGSSGADTLNGGTGSDILEGSYGDDTYVFGLGYGSDTIYDFDTTENNTDKIALLEGVAPADVSVRRNGDNLEVRITGTDDVLIIERYFSPYMRNGGSHYYGVGVNKIEQITFSDGTIWNTAEIEDKARYISGTESDDTIYAFDSDDVISSGAGNDYIDAGYGNNVVHAGDGDDTITAPGGINTLNGEAGNDAIYGGYDSDTIDGGTGNDTLEGSYGNDTYVFGLGYGTDTIYDFDTNSGNVDTISFLEGVVAADVSVVRSGDNLELRITGTDDKLIIERYFSPYLRNGGSYHYGVGVNKIEQVVFSDGTIWSTTELEDKARYINGTESNDTIYGHDSDDIITAGDGDDYIDTGYGNNIVYAGAGNDTVYAPAGINELNGEAGNDAIYGGYDADTIDGGTGNDTLEGSYGNDTYIFGSGYGADTIYDFDNNSGNIDTVTFLAGVAPEDVAVRRSGDDLVLQIVGTEDQLTVQRYFSPYMRNGGWYHYGVGVNKIEQVTFANGTGWTTTDLEDKARYLVGTSGDDTIYGFDTDDVISAGAGNDYIETGYGNNTVDAGAGDDTIYAPGGVNALSGGEGNDAIYGGYDADTLDGGTGNDTLEGSYGNDTYVFGLGYGADTIYDFDNNTGNVDTITLLEGISPEDVAVSRSGDDLILKIAGTDDQLTIQRYFSPYMRNGGWYNYGVGVNKVEQVIFADETVWTTADLEDKARYINGTSGDDYLYGFDTNEVFSAGDDDDYINTGYGNDTVNAGAGNDTIYAYGESNTLNGEDGNDAIYGGSGVDAISGGEGDDTLEGSYGNDTYLFALGDGSDTIYDFDNNTGNVDTISFQAGIAPADVIVKRNGDSLELSIQGTADKLTIQNYYSPYMRNGGWYHYGVGVNKIEKVTFADETIWTTADLEDKARYIDGTPGDDYLYGFDTSEVFSAGDGDDYINTGYGDDTVNAGAGNDTIYAYGQANILNGDAGNDAIYGGSGSDTIDGGTGNDTLEGSYGNDTYLFNLGSGTDTIYDFDNNSGNVDTVAFGEGITPAGVVVQRNGDNLELSIEGTADKLVIQNYFSPYMRNGGWYHYGVGVNKIEQFTFSDNTVWDTADVEDMALTINGTAGDDALSGYDSNETINGLDGNDTINSGYGNDTIFAGAGNDTVYANGGVNYIDGGTGNDALYGGWENDTYVFGEGYGADTISDYGDPNNEDKVLFDFDQSDLILSYSGNNLVISVANATDTLTLTSWSQNQYYQIETLQASDGSTLANTQVDQLIQAMATYASQNNGISWQDALQQNPQDVQAILAQYWVPSN